MADFNKIEKKMEEGRHKEETKYEEQNHVTCHPPLSPSEPHTCLMITDGTNGSEKNGSRKNGCERHMFYSFTEDHNFVQLVHELKDKNVACCYGGWLILSDNSTDDCSILNILTMEKLELPPLPSELCNDFVMSSPVMDRSCQIIFIERDIYTFWSCHLGDSEFIERDLTYTDGVISDHINFKGKLYAVMTPSLNLITFDFSDPDLDYEQVISGEPLCYLSIVGGKYYLAESCEDLLLICIGSYSHEVSDFHLFKADFNTGKWVQMKTLGDRTIFLGSRSSSATTLGMKGNAIYWVTTPFSKSPSKRRLYMYDIKDKSISMSLLDPVVPSLFAVSFPMTCNEDRRPEQKATIKSSMLQFEQRKTEETNTIMVRKESLWADLPTELLLEIFPHLFAGDSVAFRSVCRSWYSISPPFRTIPPLESSLGLSSPLLMSPDYPIHGVYHRLGAKVRATRDGWLLMEYYVAELIFYNTITKSDFSLPRCGAKKYYSVCFSAPPTSTDCLVVVAAKTFYKKDAIYFKRIQDEDWTCSDISSFRFSYCNSVIYKGLYYFLEKGPNVGGLLIFSPKKKRYLVIEAQIFFPERRFQCEEQHMLESDDGKLIAVFVGAAGSSVYTCEWNVYTSKWKILRSLGNMMLFVSRPLSLCKRATVRGTGNKIYFPRLVCDDQSLFYSLATKRYHTFEMGSCYSNFSTSKYYPQYNGWFMP